jgi:putative methanogenesis marker protein 8
MGEHILESMGKAKVTIRNGKVIEVENDPKIEYCPLFHKHRGIEKINKKSIKENMEFRIYDFGMCSPKRILKMKDFLSFGISEILSTLINEDMIDCVVMVCDGCGTVIVTDEEMAQGIGGRMSGVVRTTIIPEIVEKIGRKNVLNPDIAIIDQPAGIQLAKDIGYKNIAVTISKSEEVKIVREMEKKYNENSADKIRIYIFAVHTTGIDKEEASELFDYCDVITACASKHIRDIGEKIATKKVGESIPIYGASEKGKEFLELRVEKIGGIKPKKNPKLPKPLI